MLNSSVVAFNASSAKWKWLNIIDFLLPLYLIYTVPALYLGLHYDYLVKGFSILVTLLYLFKNGFYRSKDSKIFTLFFLLVSLSFIQYLYNNRPFLCYLTDASNYLAAMIFFYVGASDDRPGKPLYRKFMFYVTIVFAAGLICFVLMPPWYLSRIQEIINLESGFNYGEETILERMRFSAFFGDSYNVSHFSVFCCAIALFEISVTKGKYKYISLACLIIGLLSSIASLHRASILGCVIAFTMYFYLNHRMHKYGTNVYVLTIIITAFLLFLIVAPYFNERVTDIFGMVTNRVDDNMNLNRALNERKFTKELLASMNYYIFGHGLGSGGVGVRQYGFPGVSDMQYVKMFYENGIVGAFLFILIIVRALRRGIKYIEYYVTEVIIILFILLAMLGSNSLAIGFFLIIPFWYAIGRISNTNYLKQQMNNK